MSDASDHESRSRSVADSLRTFLITVNTGGIGAAFVIAGSLIDKGVDPRWARYPILFFLVGLVIIGVSLLLAKHKELKRRDAVKAGIDEPNFSGIFWRSYTWDLLSLVFFVLGALSGLWSLSCVQITYD